MPQSVLHRYSLAGLQSYQLQQQVQTYTVKVLEISLRLYSLEFRKSRLHVRQRLYVTRHILRLAHSLGPGVP